MSLSMSQRPELREKRDSVARCAASSSRESPNQAIRRVSDSIGDATGRTSSPSLWIDCSELTPQSKQPPTDRLGPSPGSLGTPVAVD